MARKALVELRLGRSTGPVVRLPVPAAEALRRGDEVVVAGTRYVVAAAFDRAPGGARRVRVMFAEPPRPLADRRRS